MDIEAVREFALSLHPEVTEELFAEEWISWRIAGKWFLLMQLDAPEPRVAVKLTPETAIELRERYDGVRPAYHMNKKHQVRKNTGIFCRMDAKYLNSSKHTLTFPITI